MPTKDSRSGDGNRSSPLQAHEICAHAAELVAGDRDRMHGDKAINFGNIAHFWNAYLQSRFGMHGAMVRLRGVDVGNMLEAMKIARRCSGAHNSDDYVDGAGYAGCAGELAEADAAIADAIRREAEQYQ